MPFESFEEVVEVAERILQHLPEDVYPHLTEMITRQARQPGYGHADEFEFGLDLILDALERLRDRG